MNPAGFATTRTSTRRCWPRRSPESRRVLTDDATSLSCSATRPPTHGGGLHRRVADRRVRCAPAWPCAPSRATRRGVDQGHDHHRVPGRSHRPAGWGGRRGRPAKSPPCRTGPPVGRRASPSKSQLMASTGPPGVRPLQRVPNPTAPPPPLDRYLNIARRAVRDTTALRSRPTALETFGRVHPVRDLVAAPRDAATSRKGEAVFFAQIRRAPSRTSGPGLTESKSGFRIRLDDPGKVERIVHPGGRVSHGRRLGHRRHRSRHRGQRGRSGTRRQRPAPVGRRR